MAEVGELRVVSAADQLEDVGERLSLPRVALAPALVEPATRLLSDGEGAAVLLRRQWVGDGSAEAVVLHRAGVPLEHPAVVATAVAWGCERVRHATTDRTVPIHPPPADASPVDRFRQLAALAATRVEVAVALAPDGADEAAHTAAADVLRALAMPVVSEERRDGPVPDGSPWVVLDPLDGTGNFCAGLPPWAFSAALVEAGRPVAGLVVDLSSGRRWSGAEGPAPGGTACRSPRTRAARCSCRARRGAASSRCLRPPTGCGSPAAPRSSCAWSPTVRRRRGTTSTAAAATCTTSPAGSPSCWRPGVSR